MVGSASWVLTSRKAQEFLLVKDSYWLAENHFLCIWTNSSTLQLNQDFLVTQNKPYAKCLFSSVRSLQMNLGQPKILLT